MIKRSLLAASLLALFAAAPAQAAGPYSAIYSFGDSLSDVGNVFTLTGLPGNGPQFPKAPYVNGQFSNGAVWNQDLAKYLHLGPLTPSLVGGNGYAWGGATTGYAVTANPLVPTFVQQVQQFSADHSSVAPSDALYTLSIGGDDLTHIIGTFTTLPQALVDVQGAAAALASGVATLAGEGMQQLVLFDVPDLGLTPKVMAYGPAVSAVATQLSAAFNFDVIHDLDLLIAGGLKVYDLNTFGLIDAVVANPAHYGFTNADTACYSGDYLSGGGSVCGSPKHYLFWDQFHPTAAGHAIIAKLAYQEVTAVPEPASWALALIGFAGLGFAARRRSSLALDR